MKKKVLLVLILGICLLNAGCGCGGKEKQKKNNKENEFYNTNEGVVKEQIIDKIKFTNVTLYVENGLSKFKVSVVNKRKEKVHIENVKILFKNKDNRVLSEAYGYIGYEMSPDEMAGVVVALDLDLKEIYKVEYQIK